MGCGCKANRKSNRKWLRHGGKTKTQANSPCTGETKNSVVIKK